VSKRIVHRQQRIPLSLRPHSPPDQSSTKKEGEKNTKKEKAAAKKRTKGKEGRKESSGGRPGVKKILKTDVCRRRGRRCVGVRTELSCLPSCSLRKRSFKREHQKKKGNTEKRAGEKRTESTNIKKRYVPHRSVTAPHSSSEPDKRLQRFLGKRHQGVRGKNVSDVTLTHL